MTKCVFNLLVNKSGVAMLCMVFVKNTIIGV